MSGSRLPNVGYQPAVDGSHSHNWHFLDLGYNMQDWCIASCISRGLDVVYISAGLSDSIRTYAGFRVLELIFCFAGYDIATCNIEDCRGFGEFYS